MHQREGAAEMWIEVDADVIVPQCLTFVVVKVGVAVDDEDDEAVVAEDVVAEDDAPFVRLQFAETVARWIESIDQAAKHR